jgi:LAO/AO transport system kinase
VLDAAGCDVVLVETVGVGQSELEVASLADTTLVLLAPGAGDGIQAAKAGIMEIADLLVVNKADQDGADRTVRELRSVQAMGHRSPGAWQPPVLRTVAITDSGIGDVLAGVEQHQRWLDSSGEGWRRRVTRAAREVEALALAGLRERLGDAGRPGTLARLAEQVASGEIDPYRAADELVAQL